MQVTDERNLETIPVGPLGIIPLESCKELGDRVNNYLVACVMSGNTSTRATSL